MAYGLQINKADGTNIYDSSVVTWLQVGQFEFPAMDADVRFVAGTTYNIGDFVRNGTGFNEGSSQGERWERINSNGSTSSDPQAENDANELAGNPVNWRRAEVVITWDIPFPSTFTANNLTTMTQLIDTPPDNQEGYLPHISVNTLRLRVSPFFGYHSEKVIVIVLVKG